MTTQQIIVQGDCTKLLSVSDVAQCDVMLTDPPYSAKVHSKAVSCTGSEANGFSDARKRDFGFESLHPGGPLHSFLSAATSQIKRWSVLYSDIESTHLFRSAAESMGAIYIRTLPWIRWSMPQLSGDRPPSGREDLLIFHRACERQDLGPDPVEDLILFYGAKKGAKAWNGPGNLTHLAHKCLRGSGKHPTEKPLDQALDLVNWFSAPGETVLDPCAGSGVIGLACKILGRNYIGCELDPKWSFYGTQRIADYLGGTKGLSTRDLERYNRWLGTEATEAKRQADIAAKMQVPV